MTNPIRYVVGIDAGSKTGLAVFDRETKYFSHITTTTFEKVPFWLVDNLDVALIIIEQPIKRISWRKAVNQKDANAKAADVGGVIREATLLGRMIATTAKRYSKNYTIQTASPQKGLTKLTAEEFTRMTGYKGRTSNHARDAGMLCWGR